MHYPILEISLEKLRHNISIIAKTCNELGIQVVGVNKVSCGSCNIAQAMIDSGIEIIADSRMENIIRLKELEVKTMLLRLPMVSEIEDVVEYADISLNSELKVIKCLSEAALKKGKVHSIILMIDVGDLREGIFEEEETIEDVAEILNLKGVKLLGIGTNLSCFGGVIPSRENLGRLVELKNILEKKFNIKIEIVSGGNSSSYHLIQSGTMVDGINQLRLGTSLLLGTVEINDTRIEDTYNDAFRIIAEIVEVKNKPSVPIGEIGIDAFRRIPVFEDKGIRKKAICAIGKQDVDIEWMIPVDENMAILGGSSDHLIVDITDCKTRYDVGDKISFVLDYLSILKAMTSEYVKKVYI